MSLSPKAGLRLLTLANAVTLALTALAIALSLMSAAQALGVQPWDASAWWTFALPTEKDVWFLVSFAGAAQAFIQYFRMRAAWRIRALDGNADVMPLALPSLIRGADEQAEDAPTSASLLLRWELTARGRTRQVMGWSILTIFGFGFATLVFWLLSALPSPDAPFNVLMPAMGIALILIGLLALMMALFAAVRGPVGVSADSAGISQWTPPGGHGIFIPWREARLLEASWFAVASEQLIPYIRVYRVDGASIRWPLFNVPTAGGKPNYHALDSAAEETSAAAHALVRLATAGSGLPIRTTHRSLTDPAFKLEQEISGPMRGGPLSLVMALTIAALGIATLAYRWDAAPWLSAVAERCGGGGAGAVRRAAGVLIRA